MGRITRNMRHKTQSGFLKTLETHSTLNDKAVEVKARRALFSQTLKSEREQVKELIDAGLFEVSVSKFHYGSKSKNPLENLYYFTKNDRIIRVSGHLDEAMVPRHFQSRKFMLVYKGRDRISEELKEKIAAIFQDYYQTDVISEESSSGLGM